MALSELQQRAGDAETAKELLEEGLQALLLVSFVGWTGLCWLDEVLARKLFGCWMKVCAQLALTVSEPPGELGRCAGAAGRQGSAAVPS